MIIRRRRVRIDIEQRESGHLFRQDQMVFVEEETAGPEPGGRVFSALREITGRIFGWRKTISPRDDAQ